MSRSALLPWIKSLLSRHCSVQIFCAICINQRTCYKANALTKAAQRRQRVLYPPIFFSQIISFQPVIPALLASYSVRGSFQALPQPTCDHCTDVIFSLFIQKRIKHAPSDRQWDANRQSALPSKSLDSNKGSQIKSDRKI